MPKVSGERMKPIQDAVIDWKLALHNWRRDPSNENLRTVILCGDLVCGYALDSAAQIERLTLENENGQRG